jgi:uncharacterized protein DUF29
MPDDLYWDDTLLWSEQQAARLRRVAAGERVNDVDWERVIEEIEDVGNSELRACKSLLVKAIEHLLKLHGWPGHPANEHWHGEVLSFLTDALLAFSPSMRQKIDLADLYRRALRAVRPLTMDGQPAQALPETCPFALDDLLAEEVSLDSLLTKLRA